jgi:2,3-bisphosphoglycerate-independent phosphoglycerate mutase
MNADEPLDPRNNQDFIESTKISSNQRRFHRSMRVLFVFVDGVGLGSDDACVNAMVEGMPRLSSLLGAPPVLSAAPHSSTRATLVALDATLGIDGLPQSGTGQAVVLTGEDAIRMHGRHFGPWVPTRLRPLVREQSVLARAQAAGHTIAFANAYPEEVLALEVEQRRTPPFLRAGPPLAALGAGVMNRHTAALERGDAVASEIVNDGWRERLHRSNVPHIDEARAAHNLVKIAAAHDLTLFAHYATDYAGHLRDFGAASAAIARVDTFLAAMIDSMPADMLLVVASDHGNIEDSTAGHTRNPALGLVAGPGHAQRARGMEDLRDVAGVALTALNR